MDKLTAIKIKYNDGTYSDEIPVSVLAENVRWSNNNNLNLTEVLGNVKTTTAGTVQDQIDALINEKADVSDVTSLGTRVTNVEIKIGGIASGTPPTAGSTSEMDHDVSAVYINTTDGKWYYWDGSDWQPGGVYGGAVTSTTFNQHGVPADDFAVGEALAEKADADDVEAVEGDVSDLKEDLSESVGDLKNAINESVGAIITHWEQGGISTSTGKDYNNDNMVKTAMISLDKITEIYISSYDVDTYNLWLHEYNTPDNYKSAKLLGYEVFTPTTSYIRLRLERKISSALTPSDVSMFFYTKDGYINEVAKEGAVRYDESQSLTENQKLSARNNIGVDFGALIELKANKVDTSIPSGADLNDYTTPGNYIIATTSIATSLVNGIGGKSGRLIVMTVNSNNNIAQFYITAAGMVFIRYNDNSGWSKWSTNGKSLNVYGTISIKENDDMNDYVYPGNYNVPSNSIVVSLINWPSTRAGRLTVYTVNSMALIYQEVIDTEGNVYSRRKNNNGWLAWTYHAYRKNPFELKSSDATSIPSGADLNDYTTPGNYSIATKAIGSKVNNIPEAVSGRLIVLQLNATAAVHQWYMASSNNWYIRELISGQWSNWKHLIDEEMYFNASRSAYNAIAPIVRSAPYNISFANAFAPLSLKNYAGNIQNVHPKVLYFENGFGGHKYWMAYTPYPYSNDNYENPCIAFSDDGLVWENYSGNPLSDPGGYGYNSDTHLVYRSDTNTLECWYRYVGDEAEATREERIYRRTTTDGVNWNPAELVYSNTSGSYSRLLSPAVEFDGSQYNIWVVNGSVINYYVASKNDVSEWTFVRAINLSFSDDGVSVNPWHLDAIMDDGKYVLLIMCRNSQDVTIAKCSLFITTSNDNISYTTPIKVVGGADSWDKYMYRSSIVKLGNKYRIYYSAGKSNGSQIYTGTFWGIGITESESLTSGYYGFYE